MARSICPDPLHLVGGLDLEGDGDQPACCPEIDLQAGQPVAGDLLLLVGAEKDACSTPPISYSGRVLSMLRIKCSLAGSAGKDCMRHRYTSFNQRAFEGMAQYQGMIRSCFAACCSR